MNDLKSPCRGCPNEFKSKTKEPCEGCPLPGQYDDALKVGFFPAMDFLRQSTPDNWGMKKTS